jgi:hypothetical protein
MKLTIVSHSLYHIHLSIIIFKLRLQYVLHLFLFIILDSFVSFIIFTFKKHLYLLIRIIIMFILYFS